MRIEVASKPQSVTVVRAVLAAVAGAFQFEAELVNDLKTAVSEACNNVVMHAYQGQPGPLAVAVAIGDGCVDVSVCDDGLGIQHAAPAEDRMGVGLAVMTALATRAEFTRRVGGGTEVRMMFARPQAGAEQVAQAPPAAETPSLSPSLAGDVVVALTPIALLGEVLGRAARTLAAAAHLSLERFSDVYLVADAVAAHARRAAGKDDIGFSLTAGDRRLDVAVGPLRAGSGKPNGSADPMLPLLVDELRVERDDGTETLRLVVADQAA